VFKNCPRWKPQQKIPWAEVRKESGRGKDRFTIRDLLADTRCSQPVLYHGFGEADPAPG
jgi:hypothetical protein